MRSLVSHVVEQRRLEREREQRAQSEQPQQPQQPQGGRVTLDTIRQTIRAGGDPTDVEALGRQSQRTPGNVEANFLEIMGRPMTEVDRFHFDRNVTEGTLSYNHYLQGLSVSSESRVNPADYGVRAADPPVDNEFYQAWRRANPNAEYTNVIEMELGWHQDFGSLEVYQGRLDGTIVDQGGVTYVTPAAVARYGEENLRFSGSNAGDMIATPTDSNIQIRRSTSDMSGEASVFSDALAEDGYQLSLATGTPRKGLAGKMFGRSTEERIARALPAEISLMADPLGISIPRYLGAAGAERQSGSLSRVGVNEERLVRAQHMGRNITQGALMAAGGYGWLAAGALTVLGAESDRVRYGGSRSDHMARGAKGYGVGASSTINPFLGMAAQTGLAYSEGGDARANMWSELGWSVASRYTGGASHFVRAGTDDDYSYEDATWATASALGAQMIQSGDAKIGQAEWSWNSDGKSVWANVGAGFQTAGSRLWDHTTHNIFEDFRGRDPETKRWGDWSLRPEHSRTNPLGGRTWSKENLKARTGFGLNQDESWDATRSILTAPYRPQRWAAGKVSDWAPDWVNPGTWKSPFRRRGQELTEPIGSAGSD